MKAMGTKIKIYQLKNTLIWFIKPYLSDIINDYKAFKNSKDHSSSEVSDHKTQFDEWKIQLMMSINFISSKDSDEICHMLTKSNNIEIMVGSERDKIIEELLKSLLQRYQEGLEESI